MPIQGQLFLDINICRGAASESVHNSTSITSITGGSNLQLVWLPTQEMWLRRYENMAVKRVHHSWSRLHELTETLHELVKGAGTNLPQHSHIKLKFTLQNPQEDETKLLQILFPITITMAFHKIEITST